MIKILSSLTKFERFLLSGYIIVSLSLFLYSFTQIDLGLVISRFPFLFSIEQVFQQVGYFNRPLSTALFVLLISLFSLLYIFVFRSIKKISLKALWIIICIICTLLFFSYNAFSYDLFNYIFDAKIFTYYHANPYVHKALDYPSDPMLSFMHWTHRTYPYGPIWLAISIPLSYIGLHIFLPTLYLFKLLILLSFIGTTFFIGRILRIISPDSEKVGVMLFALNPLVIIETLISSHNDMFMMFLGVFSLWLLLENKKVLSGITFLLSVGTKFATLFLLPVYALLFIKRKQITENYWNTLMIIGSGLMIIAVILAASRANFQPWYVIFILPFVSLMTKYQNRIYPVLLFSFVALCNYIPYLYTGTWTTEMIHTLTILNGICGIVFVVWFLVLVKTNRS